MRCARMSASDASRDGDGGIHEELATDMIIKSIRGPRGYLKHLESDAAARENFAAFMKGYYPP